MDHWLLEDVGSEKLVLGGWVPSECKLGSPPFISHEVRPFVRGTARSLGDENDHHGY